MENLITAKEAAEFLHIKRDARRMVTAIKTLKENFTRTGND